MQSDRFDLLGAELSRPVDALALLARALRHRSSGLEAEIILDEVELGLGELRRQLSSVLALARAEHCLAALERTEFPLAAVLGNSILQMHRVVYDTGARLSVVRTGAIVVSDRNALEIILRSLLAAALHPAGNGRVLVGARRRGSEVQVQVRAKPGASESGMRAARSAYRRDPAPEASALALEIACTLAQGLGHEIHLCPNADGGAMFSIAVPRALGVVCAELGMEGSPT